jgi:hypothetical protein
LEEKYYIFFIDSFPVNYPELWGGVFMYPPEYLAREFKEDEKTVKRGGRGEHLIKGGGSLEEVVKPLV